MLDTVKINHVQHISFTQSRLTDAVSVILSELLSYEHPSKGRGLFPINEKHTILSDEVSFFGAGNEARTRFQASRKWLPAICRSPASPHIQRAAHRWRHLVLFFPSTKNTPSFRMRCPLLERATRLELATSTLARWRSTR